MKQLKEQLAETKTKGEENANPPNLTRKPLRECCRSQHEMQEQIANLACDDSSEESEKLGEETIEEHQEPKVFVVTAINALEGVV